MITALGDKTAEVSQVEFPKQDFARLYIEARRKEHRLYTNEEVLQLPDVSPSNILFKEWQVRKRSAKMLTVYLSKKNRPLRILEVGCGNGWLCANLAKVKQSDVVGIDINEVELNQAKDVFHRLNNVKFFCTGINDNMLQPNSFDVVLFAASIQYFASINRVVRDALSLLGANGEIHIIDTHFYKPGELQAAKKRTKDYYTTLGFPEMSKYYHHSSLSDFSSFNFSILFAPSFLRRNVFRNTHPFHWIKIRDNK